MTYALLSFVVALAGCGSAPAPETTTPEKTVTKEPEKTAATPATPSVLIPAAIAEIVAAADRSDDDKALDAGRHPAEILAFFGIAPGMKVADLAAGFGYTTELLARAVGPNGKIYGQNNKFVLEKFAEKGWTERLAKPVNKNVIRVNQEFDQPIPSDVHDLDAVIMVLFYHDTVWQKADRAKMNQSIFAALKSGGVYGIIDHSGRDGTGTTETDTLHRIEEKVVREEVTKAGFKLADSADFLKNPADTRDWNASPRAAAEKRGTSDRFVLKFVKP
ncbi:MAG TPA: SAM-dependent methyltransferase [Polyangium sp.]|nr:SAM-dependent methyltransferase [Polyangium sp.]